MDEIDFARDDFADIVGRDDRYAPRAYALLTDVLDYLGEHLDKGGHMSGEDILDEFKERALDQYGPLTYTVLAEWGVKSCADIGEMMFNLVESKRIRRDEDDSYEVFASGYDFEETFRGPYRV